MRFPTADRLLAPRVNQPCRRQRERGQCWVPGVVHVQVPGHWCCWCQLGRAGHALPGSRCCTMARPPIQLRAKHRLFWRAGMAAICLCFARCVHVKGEEWICSISAQPVVSTMVRHCCPLSLLPSAHWSCTLVQAPSPPQLLPRCPSICCAHRKFPPTPPQEL